jgi:GNAT superfamily N-acetyltransferase
MIIRNATPADCPRLLQLIQELADYENAHDQVTVSPEHFLQSGFGEKPVWWALVVEEDELVQGFALYYIRFSTWKGQRIYLEDLLVTEQMRGKGAGKLLLDKLIEEAKAKGFNGISWQVLNWNEPAINFYKKYPTEFDGEWTNCALNF